MLDKIKDLYSESIQTQISASQLLPEQITRAVQNIVACLLRGNKIIVCAQGRSYANAQFLVANLLNRYELERPSFPSVLLSLDSAVGSAIIADHHFERLFQHQFNALAQPGDLLVILTPFGDEEAVLNVLHCAFNKEIGVIALTGANNVHVSGLLTENDVEISVPASKESRISEHHLFIINLLCELVDYRLFAQNG